MDQVEKLTGAFLIATTDNFKSFTDAMKYAYYWSIDLFPNSSGIKKGKRKMNPKAKKRIKVLLSKSIISAIIYNPEISLCLTRKINEGKLHGIVYNAIKNKLILRAFAVVRRQTPYVNMMNYA